MKNEFEQLQTMTTIVADTGDIEAIRQFRPTDATTNPSLILKAAELPQYLHLVEEAVNYANRKALTNEQRSQCLMDKLFVNFGLEILKIIPGRVSTEVDARLSFDVEGSIEKARTLIRLYEEAKIPRDRILIKLAATWEGTVAARVLEKEGIHCNMTLLFNLAQAIECANAGATLISPFVGRILDWFKNKGASYDSPEQDPGVKSVTTIFHYLKKFGYPIQIMGASFRNREQIIELAGCDLLTIAPELMHEIKFSHSKVVRKLDPRLSQSFDIERIQMDEKTFRWMMNEDAMATEKLSEGIRKFVEDTKKLEMGIEKKFNLPALQES